MGVFGVGDGLRVTLYPPAAQGGCCGRSCSGRRCMRMALPAKNPAPPRSPPSHTAVHDEQDGGIRHGPDRSALKGLDTHRQLIALANMAACIISSATSALITTFCVRVGIVQEKVTLLTTGRGRTSTVRHEKERRWNSSSTGTNAHERHVDTHNPTASPKVKRKEQTPWACRADRHKAISHTNCVEQN